MDKPIIIHDGIAEGEIQVHELVCPPEPFAEELGLQIVQFARGQRHGSKGKLNPRRFEFFCVSQMIEGRGFYWEEEGGSFTEFGPGHAVVVTPGTVHCFGGWRDCFVEDTICFCGRIPEALKKAGLLKDGLVDLGSARRVAKVIELAVSPSPDARFKAAVALQELLWEIHSERREASAEGDSSVGRLLAEIERDVSKWWTVEEMAAFAGMSQSNFRRRFEDYAGMAPKLYMDKLKMRMAAELLASSSSTLAEIAASLGYVDQFHFSRRFKAVMGASPGAYRKGLRLLSR